MAATTVESIEEQWNPPTFTDIMSDSWIDMADAKKAVKIWILDRGESWGRPTQNNKTRLQLHCLLSTCSFYIRIAQRKDSLFSITSYTQHDCPPSTHAKFKQRNSAWYLASLVERDVTINRQIKPKEIRERAGLYHQLQQVSYMPAWRARERLRDILDGDEGASFSLIPSWVSRVVEADPLDTFVDIEVSDNNRFEAIFVMLGSTRATLHTLRPFYALDGTHTRSQYNLTLLIAVGIDGEDRVLPLAWALVPVENEVWWSWFCKNLVEAFEDDLLPLYVVISDRDKGLLNAVKSELPGADHAMCCQHIAENIHKRFGREYKAPFGRSLARRRRLTSITRLKPYREPLLRLKNTYLQLATRTLPFLAFQHLDSATIPLISWNQPIQCGVRYESFLHFSFLMEYINGILQLFMNDSDYY